MPASPPIIFAPPEAGAAPTAPGIVFVPPAAGAAPTAPGIVFVPPAAGAAPVAPGVIFTPPSAGTATGITIGGTLTPDAVSTLVRVATPAAFVFPGGSHWSETGANVRPGTGNWRELYQHSLVSTAAATLEAIAPKANYTGGIPGVATQITVFSPDFSTVDFYYLTNFGTLRWVLNGDSELVDQGATVIPAGRPIFPVRAPGSGSFVGGLGASWQANAASAWIWVLKFWAGPTQTGNWVGTGTRPNTATWTPSGSATGTPTVTGGSGGLAPPVAVFGA